MSARRPLVDRRALDTVAGRVEEAVAGGAKVLAGGGRVGRCLPGRPAGRRAARQRAGPAETFGRVATVEVVDGAEEAVARANDTAYGLAAGILTGDPDRGLALADRLQAGIVHVNDQPVGEEPQMPFGGVKDSGWPLRRPGRRRAVHRAGVGDGAERHPPVPLLVRAAARPLRGGRRR
jgi:acyl-CoA reductase-like NAD-dependent aldehyde dehydrogenase